MKKRIEKIGKVIEKLENKIKKLGVKAEALEKKYKGKLIKAELERRKRLLAQKANNLRTKIKRLEKIRLYHERVLKEKEERKKEKGERK